MQSVREAGRAVAVTDYSLFTGRCTIERPPPRLDLIEIAWRMRAPSARILECEVYQNDFGDEARMGYSEQLLASHRGPTVEDARRQAEMLRDAAPRIQASSC